MTDVPAEPQQHLDTPLLEVTVQHPKDAIAATEGEADRLLLVADPEQGLGTSPDLATVSSVRHETDLPLRVLLVASADHRARAEDYDVLLKRALSCAELEVEGFAFGFLRRDLGVDVLACEQLAGAVGLPWSFHRAFDDSLDPDAAWQEVRDLPGLDGVTSAGSSRGIDVGGDQLAERAARDADCAALLIADCGTRPDLVPWLVRSGAHQFTVGSAVRQDGSWKRAYADAARVRTWRMLLDDAHARALGVPVD